MALKRSCLSNISVQDAKRSTSFLKRQGTLHLSSWRGLLWFIGPAGLNLYQLALQAMFTALQAGYFLLNGMLSPCQGDHEVHGM